MRNHLVAIIAIFLLGCSTKIPMNQDDICVIIDENPRWSNSLLDAKKKWNAEPSTVMAIIRQESSFDANAAPALSCHNCNFFIGVLYKDPNEPR